MSFEQVKSFAHPHSFPLNQPSLNSYLYYLRIQARQNSCILYNKSLQRCRTDMNFVVKMMKFLLCKGHSCGDSSTLGSLKTEFRVPPQARKNGAATTYSFEMNYGSTYLFGTYQLLSCRYLYSHIHLPEHTGMMYNFGVQYQPFFPGMLSNPVVFYIHVK